MADEELGEKYSDSEISRRLDAGLKKSLQMKPKPHAKKKAGARKASPRKKD